MPDAYDVICIGAGPTGLACAIEAKRAGMRPLVIDKGCLCNSLYHYPVNMIFFTTPERMEIGDLPMTIAAGKPTRAEALKYYRRAVEHYGIETRLYETVDRDRAATTARSSSTPTTNRREARISAARKSSSPPATTIVPIRSTFPAKICRTSRTISPTRIRTGSRMSSSSAEKIRRRKPRSIYFAAAPTSRSFIAMRRWARA